MQTTVPEELVRLLRCPKCRHPVAPDGTFLACANPACGLRYPVVDGIPVMLIEDAAPPRSASPAEATPAP